MSIITRFSKNCLIDFTYPNKYESWHVQGMLKNKSNQIFKFDVRDMSKVSENKLEKQVKFNSKAEKMVFETITHWIIFDTEELNKYVKSTNKIDFNIDELLDNLSWNLILSK